MAQNSKLCGIIVFSMVMTMTQLALCATSNNCPRKVTISYYWRATIINDEDWKDKIGSYTFTQYDDYGNAIYEHDQTKGVFLYKKPSSGNGEGNWMVGNEIGKDFGWIGNSNCRSSCPSSCADKTWVYWHGITGGEGVWKQDPTLRVDGCVKWRQTGNCMVNGPREPKNDKKCNEKVTWKSGYCECTNGRTAMEKGCEMPSFYDYEYDTCEEACAYMGAQRNNHVEVPIEDRMQDDQPFSDGTNQEGSDGVELRTRFELNGQSFWTCSSVTRTTYPNYEDAEAACVNDAKCSFVLDEDCNNSGAFKLCPVMALIERSTSDCIYNKHR